MVWDDWSHDVSSVVLLLSKPSHAAPPGMCSQSRCAFLHGARKLLERCVLLGPGRHTLTHHASEYHHAKNMKGFHNLKMIHGQLQTKATQHHFSLRTISCAFPDFLIPSAGRSGPLLVQTANDTLRQKDSNLSINMKRQSEFASENSCPFPLGSAILDGFSLNGRDGCSRIVNQPFNT